MISTKPIDSKRLLVGTELHEGWSDLLHAVKKIKGLHRQTLPLKPVSREEELPLSFAQQRLWFLSRLEPNSPVYSTIRAYRIRGPLNVAVLEQSLNEIVRRHEILRTTFPAEEGEPVQVIAPTLTLSLPVIDIQEFTESERMIETRRFINGVIKRPFNLAQGPLVRTTLLQLGQGEYVLLMSTHHILFAGQAWGGVNRELSVFYEAFSAGKSSPLPDLSIQYADFAYWQRKWLQGAVLDALLSYWKQQLGNGFPSLPLPTDRPRPAVQSFQSERQSFAISKHLTDSLKYLSRREGITLFTTLLAAFKVLLYRYTAQQDILVFSPAISQSQSELRKLIGLFTNFLPLRTDLSENPPFRKLLGRVRETVMGAYAHQEMPFDKLVDELQLQRSSSHMALFQVLFIYHNTPAFPLKLSDLTLSPLEIDRGTAKFDLSLFMENNGQNLTASLRYKTDLFDADTITRMIGHFQTLLEGIVIDPEKRISSLPLLTQVEQQKMLVTWNDTQTKYSQDESITQLFEAQVERNPEATAFLFEDQELSYDKLNRRANQVAHYLQRLGVGPEVVVGLCIKPSFEMVVGVLGILKAGGAYLALDPTYPKERLAFMLEDAQVPVFLTQKQFEAVVPKGETQIIYLDSDGAIIAQQSEENPDSYVATENLAYVAYTSGSTGKPKGVLGLHRGAVNRFKWMWKTYPFEADEVCCLISSLSFVDSVWEIFGPLLRGISIVIIPNEVLKDPHLLVNALAQNHVTRIVLVPSLLHVILETYDSLQDRLPALKFWFSSGEALSIELCRRFMRITPQGVLINLYGLAEVSADSIWYDTSNGKLLTSVPVGRPIANTQIYILDSNLQLVPIGVPGELHIGGAGLARGYLNRPGLTAKTFIPNFFSDKINSRLYKTGDLGRWQPDGNIEVIGRIDTQVKIRGFRIELGEIEAVLSLHPDVRDAVVTTREYGPDDKRLVAYIVLNREQTSKSDQLRRYLKQKLPYYMVPSIFVLVDALPLMPNGKVDHRALPAPDKVKPGPAVTFVTPHDELELQLQKIWEKILGVKNVGIIDNFFDLGGDSLLAVRLFSEIQKIFSRELPLATLFQAPTIDKFASIIRQEGYPAPWSSLVPIQPGGSRPPFFCIHGCTGRVLHFYDLARLLGPEQPFYGLGALGLEKEHVPHNQIEDMAAHYIKEIRSIQFNGPYFIGGSGAGCTIVLEMAHQLESQGQNLALLVLMTPSPNQPNLSYSDPSAYGKSLGKFFYLLINLIKRRPLIPAIKNAFLNRILWHWRIFHRFIPIEIHRWRHFRDDFNEARLSYTPKAYRGRITYFLREEFSRDPQKGIGDWYDIAVGGLDVRLVPGTINSMWWEPHVQILAEQLKACLGEAQMNGQEFIKGLTDD